MQLNTLQKYHTSNHNDLAHFFTIADNLNRPGNPRCIQNRREIGYQNVLSTVLAIKFRMAFPAILLPFVGESRFTMIMRKQVMAMLELNGRFWVVQLENRGAFQLRTEICFSKDAA